MAALEVREAVVDSGLVDERVLGMGWDIERSDDGGEYGSRHDACARSSSNITSGECAAIQIPVGRSAHTA
jgi:hypothetical protein